MATTRINRKTLVDEFVRLVQQRVKADKVSMTELSRLTGITRQHLYRIVRGDHVPTLSAAEKIAAALGLQLTISQKTA